MVLEDYLRDLADETTPLVTGRLTELSSLWGAEAAAFRQAWPAIPAPRRTEIVRLLGELAEDNVELDYDAVFLVALDDADPAIRLAAIQGLWEYEGRDLIEPLIRLLKDDPEPGVRAGAALGLGQFEVLAEFDQLRASDVERVDRALLDVIENDSEAVDVRARAVESVGARAEPWAHDVVEDAYNSGEPRLRVSALHAMGRSADADWLPVLFDHLEDDDPEVRYEAVLACGAIADEAAAESVVALMDDEDVEVRFAAITALGEIGGDDAEAALRVRLSDDDEVVREAVREALQEIRETRELLDFEAGL